MPPLPDALWRCRRSRLRRRSDALETWAAAVLILVFLVTAPLAARATHTAVLDSAARQRAETYQVTAVLQQTAPEGPGTGPVATQKVRVPVRWTAHDGSVRVDHARVERGTKAGTAVGLWAERGGAAPQLVPQPPSGAQSAVWAVIHGVGVAHGIGLLLLLVWVLIRIRTDQRRLGAWEREWAHYGPRWGAGGR